MRERKMVSWDDLPRDLWEPIFEHFDHVIDRLWFMAVCRTFNSYQMDPKSKSYRLSRPLLLLPPSNIADNSTSQLYSFTDSTTYDTYIPELQEKWCFGSSFGWLFTASFGSSELSLLNPINRAQILLPPIPIIHDGSESESESDEDNPIFDVSLIEKAAVSSSPSVGHDFIVMALINCLCSLCFCKPGYNEWVELPSDDLHFDCHYQDITYYKDKFYAISNSGALIAWDLSDTNSPSKTIIIDPPGQYIGEKEYLVVSIHNEIFKLRRLRRFNKSNTFQRTVRFKVYKFDEDEKKWVKGCLHNQAVFVGYNAFSVSTVERPEFEEQGIYFTDAYNGDLVCDNPRGCNDVGMYDVKRGKIVRFCNPHPFWHDPCIWFTPSL